MIPPEWKLTNLLKNALDSEHVPKEDLVRLEETFQRYVEQFQTLRVRLPVEVAHVIHAATDKTLEAEKAQRPDTSGNITCRKGCSHCCRLFVGITPPEAEILVAMANYEHIPMDQAKLERQAAHCRENWHDQPAEDQACVFLGMDGTCRVYENRPNACRKHFVVTEAEFCRVERNSEQKVRWWFSPEAEVIASASMTVFGVGGMAEQLLGVLRKPLSY